MTRAQLKEQADASLEIISIGSLYAGSWDKKYWSSSRGKDRYPYPVGYQVIRAYNGIKYKMEIHEGPMGPLFMILSMDGSSFSGQTPDIAWEMFQRKGCLHTKIWHGKRSSCKVDGVEFFGFKNPFIQRLLRELVANVSGTAELDPLPSNLCNKASGSAQTAVEHHSVDECENAELVFCHEKSKTARKRRSRHGTEMEKSLNGANLKKVQNHGSKIRSMTAKLSSTAFVNEVNQGFCEKAMCVQEKDAVSDSTQVVHNASIDEKLHDRLSMDKLEGSSREMETGGTSVDVSIQKYCPDTEDNNHHSSDTSDLKQGILESASVSVEKKILNQPDIIILEESMMDSHPEEICSLNTNVGSKRNDFDSVGQDMVKSMMTFLLPQAIPLLKENSDRKDTSTSNSERFLCDGNTKDVLPMEKEDGEKQEYMHIQRGNYESAVPSLEFPKHGLDNLEGEQHDDRANINGNFSSNGQAQNANDSSVRTSAYSEALHKEVIVGKKAAGMDTLPSSQVPSIVYSRRKAQNVSHLAKGYKRPSNEACDTSCFEKHYGAETSSPNSPHSSDINLFTLPGNQQTEDLLSEYPLREQSPIDCSYKTNMKAEAGLERICHHGPTLDLDEASLRANNNHNSELLDKPVLKEDLEGCIDKRIIEHNNVSSTNKYKLSQEMGATFRDDSKDSYPYCNVELYREAEGMSKIVGSYLHPMPVLSIFLSNIENVIHICVLCGLSVEKNRTLITYMVEVKEPKLGYPSLVGHTTVMMPTLKDYLGKEIAVERISFQLTPDGNYLVLIGGIRTPFCRTGSINCPCSTCTSGKFEENAVNIVQVKYGYVSIIASLRSTDIVHCILVCEPDQLVAVGRGGRLNIWVMDATWGKQIESHIIPSEDHISPNLVELKGIPEFSNLVVGHNGCGEFSLWDIPKRALISRFYMSGASVNQFFPISLFSLKRKENFTNCNSSDHVQEMCATSTNSRNTEEHSSLQLRDTAIWLFASTTSDSHVSHEYLPMDGQINHAESWKLMLLANSTVTFGPELDFRASAIGASAGRGIIGTQDGLVYVWELSTGNKLGTLLCFEGANVVCIATDNKETGVVAVAAENRLLVYLLSSDGKR